jgi:hypothetical protein
MMNGYTAITGNTYPVRESLKALGGRWNPEEKAWMVPDAKADEARKIVASASHQSSNHGSTDYHLSKCKVCGAVERRNMRGYYEVKIYRSGECQDCYEERKMGY